MARYIVLLVQKLVDFRIPELESIAKLLGIDMNIVEDFYDRDSPYLLIDLPSDEDAKRLAVRSVTARYIDRLIEQACDYGELVDKVKASLDQLEKYKHKKVKLEMNSYGPKISSSERIKHAENFLSLIEGAEVRLDDPEVVFTYHEDYGCCAPGTSTISEGVSPKRLLFGVRVSDGGCKDASIYSLNKRSYKGTTSLEAVISLIMANQALADKGKMILDPFVGTGSTIVACAHYGALTFGSDIDGRNIRGSGGINVIGNAVQYDIRARVIDNLVCDFNVTISVGLETAGMLTAPQPPYGIREGARRIGRNIKRRERTDRSCFNKYPQTIPYGEEELIVDLLSFAGEYLVPRGRLVFWMSSSGEWFGSSEIPYVAYYLQLQSFGRWARHLVTMEKRVPGEAGSSQTKSIPSGWYYGRAKEAYFNRSADGKDLS